MSLQEILADREMITFLGVSFGLLILYLLLRAVMSAVQEREVRFEADISRFFEMSGSLANLAGLSSQRYLRSIASAFSTWLDLEEVVWAAPEGCREDLRALLQQRDVVIDRGRLYLVLREAGTAHILSGHLAEGFASKKGQARLERRLVGILHTLNSFRDEVHSHRRTAALARSLENQHTMIWQALAAFKHDMDHLATPLFNELFLLCEAYGGRQAAELTQTDLGAILADIARVQRRVPVFQSFIKDLDEAILDVVRPGVEHLEAIDLGALYDWMLRHWVEEQDELNPALQVLVVIPPGTTLLANEIALFQALWNPLKNAFKYTRSGRIELFVERGGEFDWVVIRDSGPGIRQEDLEHIGQFGYRSGSARELALGKGIGLWITRRMMEKMNGCFQIESQVGSGTTVRLGFPSAADGML
jgi:signal transduction histidine kinase